MGKKAKAGSTASTLGISVKRDEDFSTWYSQILVRSEMIEYYDISGCYILRPSAYFVWEQIRRDFDKMIKREGVKGAYFPIFVSKAALETEKEHVEGFAPEVAWVTKSGKSDLAEPIAIRPTSETVMYPAFAKWIRSHRDLPLKLNQWTNVVRWEFKHPTPFIRTREFLWQEGHTAHATDAEAEQFMLTILRFYERIYSDTLAVPVVPGLKSEAEKFPGGKMTTTVEAYVPANGRSIQAATSHHLGVSFSKMFNIKYLDEEMKEQRVHQTSWGLSTRSLGVMVMLHSDDKGLVMPPRVAPTQVAFVPIPMKDTTLDALAAQCDELAATLPGTRCYVDRRDLHNPGYKFNDHELKGVPLRVELGPRDVQERTVPVVRRVDGHKEVVPWDALPQRIPQMLAEVHALMLDRLKRQRDEHIVRVMNFDDVMPVLGDKKMVLAPWCEAVESEELMGERTKELSERDAQVLKDAQAAAREAGDAGELGAPALTGAMKSLCIPIEQPPMPAGTPCWCPLCHKDGKPAKRWTLFGRSY